MITLTQFYEINEMSGFEGHSQMNMAETQFLGDIVRSPSIKNILEIGFNAGHSAETFLSNNSNARLISFDLGEYDYVDVGKRFIDMNYPGRHELILGDSLITIPKFIKTNSILFDLIFIDGGHEYEVALGDLINCKSLAHSKTIVIMDDTMNNKEWINNWNVGPNKAWAKAKDHGFVEELGSIDFCNTHGLSWGMYS